VLPSLAWRGQPKTEEKAAAAQESILPVTEMVHTLFHSLPLVIEETSAAAHDRTPLVTEGTSAAVQASILPVSGE